MRNDIQEDFCSFEISKLLKEKGFQHKHYEDDEELSEKRIWVYNVRGRNHRLISYRDLNIGGNSQQYNHISEPTYDSPTHSVAIKWIRENFGICLHVEKLFLTNKWYYRTYSSDKDKIEFELKVIEMDIDNYIIYNSPEEATEAAILHVLKEII